MRVTRRTLSLKLPLLALSTIAMSPRAAKPLRILILGGTGFIGPHQVRYALARGHKVTLFNRGRAARGLARPGRGADRRPQHRRPQVARGPRVGRLHRQPDHLAVLGARRRPGPARQGRSSTSSSRPSRSTPPNDTPTPTRRPPCSLHGQGRDGRDRRDAARRRRSSTARSRRSARPRRTPVSGQRPRSSGPA